MDETDKTAKVVGVVATLDIFERREEIYLQYASAIGVTVDELEDNQKRQAIMNYILNSHKESNDE